MYGIAITTVIVMVTIIGIEAMLQTKYHKLGPDVKLQVYGQFTLLDEVESKSSTQPVTPTPSDIKGEPLVPLNPISRKMSHVMAHYVQSKDPSLAKQLEKFHVTIKIDIDDEAEVGFIHILPSVGSEKIKNWNEQCKAAIESFLKPLNSSSLPVQPQLLPKIQEIVEENKSNSSLNINFAKDNITLHIAGDSSEVTKIVKEIKCIEDTELTRKESIGFDAKRYYEKKKSVHSAKSTVLKQLKLLGDLSKCRKQELQKEMLKYFEEYYGSVSNFELHDSKTATMTLIVSDETGRD